MATKWGINLVRLTAFVVGPFDPDSGGGWWDSAVKRPIGSQTKDLKSGEIREVVDEGDSQLLLVRSAQRIDLVRRWKDQSERTQTPELKVALVEFNELCDSLLKVLPPISRVALGLAVSERFQTARDCNTKVQTYLPLIKLPPDGTYDFAFQINRRTNSHAIEGLELNRLCRWAMTEVRVIEFKIEQAQVKPGAPEKPHYVGSAEFDVNTSQDHAAELQKDKLPGLANELFENAYALAVDGYPT